jgi:hypothetical protein
MKRAERAIQAIRDQAELPPEAADALGGVDSRDSNLDGSMIQGCLGGSLGCEEPFGFERRGVGADGTADHRSA